QTAIDGPLHNAIRFTPGEVELPRRCRSAAFLHPVNGEAFEQGAESTPGFRPGHAHLLDAMLRASAAWHVGFKDGLKLASIEVAPTSRLGVVARTERTAFGTFQGCAFGPPKADNNTLSREVKLDIEHDPGIGKIQNLCIELTVTHKVAPERDRIPSG